MAKIWRADRQEWDTETVRLDGFIRQNADIDLGEYDEIHKIEPEKADSLTLAPPEETSVQFGSDAVSIVTRQILKHSVVEGDISPVISSTNQPFVRSPGQTIPLIEVAIGINGTFLITDLRAGPNSTRRPKQRGGQFSKHSSISITRARLKAFRM